jgi:hypothetical protein
VQDTEGKQEMSRRKAGMADMDYLKKVREAA